MFIDIYHQSSPHSTNCKHLVHSFNEKYRRIKRSLTNPELNDTSYRHGMVKYGHTKLTRQDKEFYNAFFQHGMGQI